MNKKNAFGGLRLAVEKANYLEGRLAYLHKIAVNGRLMN